SPREREGEAGAGAGADGPRADRRGHAAVAQIVEEDLTPPRLLGDGGGEAVGFAAADDLADLPGEGLAPVPFDAAAGVGEDGHDDMQPLAAGGLDEGIEAEA